MPAFAGRTNKTPRPLRYLIYRYRILIAAKRRKGQGCLQTAYGMMRKTQFAAYFHRVPNYFQPADQKASNVDILIIEADNGPLV